MKNLLVYKAGAGSGKTFSLVLNYLSYALSDQKKSAYYFKNILAITFTNKAAAEMKQRVLSSLEEIINTDKTAMANSLQEVLKIPYDELKGRAQLCLNGILHNYSDFAVSTIDSFTHRLVKAFTHELKLPVNFNVELDVEVFYAKVVNDLMQQIGNDKFVTELLKKFSVENSEQDKFWDPEATLKDFAKLSLKENAAPFLQMLSSFNEEKYNESNKNIRGEIKYYVNKVNEIANRFFELCSTQNISEADFFNSGRGTYSVFKKFSDSNLPKEIEEYKYFNRCIEKNNWQSKESNFEAGINNVITQFANELIDIITLKHKSYLLNRLLLEQLHNLALLSKINDLAQNRKLETQTVFISEFNKSVFELIQNEPVPFIFEKLGERYKHYLIDEFQDTSTLQFQNFLPLIDNSLASANQNLIVGDGKQSIYRWRNANVQQFTDLPKLGNTSEKQHLQDVGKSFELNYQKIILNTNYRSTKTIVEFNNEFFEYIKNVKLLPENKLIYDDLVQHSNSDKSGFVQISMDQITDSEMLTETNCNKTISIIQDALSRGFLFNDICIVCRKRDNATKLAEFLSNEGIPIISPESLLIKNNAEVSFIISFLNVIQNNNTQLHSVKIINYLSEKNKLQFSNKTELLNEIVNAEKNVFTLLYENGIEIGKHLFDFLNPLDTCAKIIELFQLNKISPQYIRFFIDEVNWYVVNENSSIELFLEWWEQQSNKASVMVPESSNAIKIMTIHKSKGLEFPIVIIPFCNWQLFNDKSSDWVNLQNKNTALECSVLKLNSSLSNAGLESILLEEQKAQQLDNVNLLYVAFTRAVDELYIIADDKSKNSEAEKLTSGWIRSFVSNKNSADNYFELGEKANKITGKQKSSEEINLSSFEVSKFSNMAKISVAEEDNEARDIGLKLHAIMANVLLQQNVQDAIENAINQQLITQKEKLFYEKTINSIVCHKELKLYFSDNVKIVAIEREILNQSGKTFRPDRVVEINNELFVIDYKTSAENSPKHHKQVEEYKTLISELNQKNSKGLLVYVNEDFTVNIVYV
ncbi:MAG: UvrD-helicase domain-containing protein [Bacteroidetes bacterium]|nr:UvrD-helicase domain-containing protein [Bacteroidota bacterium]